MSLPVSSVVQGNLFCSPVEPVSLFFLFRVLLLFELAHLSLNLKHEDIASHCLSDLKKIATNVSVLMTLVYQRGKEAAHKSMARRAANVSSSSQASCSCGDVDFTVVHVCLSPHACHCLRSLVPPVVHLGYI